MRYLIQFLLIDMFGDEALRHWVYGACGLSVNSCKTIYI